MGISEAAGASAFDREKREEEKGEGVADDSSTGKMEGCRGILLRRHY